MPSNTERSRKFRKKVRIDPIKNEEYKKRDREKKRKKYADKKATMTESEKSKVREKERLKKRKQVARKQQKNLGKSEEKTNGTFKSPQSLGRAVKKVRKSLPKENEKKTQVLSEVVNSLFPKKRRAVLESCDAAVKRRKSEESRRKIRCDALSEEQLKSVENFYNRGDISRICPGKKDYIIISQNSWRKRVDAEKVTLAECERSV